jgi:hypothetical protein
VKPSKKFLKSLKKSIDKLLKKCYNKYIKGKEMMNMRKSCMNTTYGVTIGTLLGREKMKEIRKSVSDKKSKKK